MKSLTTFIAIAFLAFSTTACSQQHTYSSGGLFGGKTVKGSKNFVTKNIKVENFEKISVAGSQDVIYKQKQGAPSLEIYTSDNIVDLLDIQVKGNTLVIGFKKGVNVSYDKLEVRVTSPNLTGVSVAGSGDFNFANGLKSQDDLSLSVAGSGDIKGANIGCNNMKVSIAGSGDINTSSISCNSLKTSVAGSGDMNIKDITTSNVEASIAGSGTILLSGKSQEASYSIAGSGDIFADGLEAKNVNTSISGSGDIKCFATDFLKVRTSGSGSVGYKGEPQLDIPKKGLYKL
ncbi:head GIN domain-containing protein [Bacteroides sp.]|uniref:head GIN domain-containing protein n=1 Tax=Bacteroides sp. TaxID=29523 RepID=UPI0026031D9A|nr:head GIN domain-containing protein [Bacteroides sp.]